jgi:hypothetical protein
MTDSIELEGGSIHSTIVRSLKVVRDPVARQVTLIHRGDHITLDRKATIELAMYLLQFALGQEGVKCGQESTA